MGFKILRFNESKRYPQKATQEEFFDKKSKFGMVDWTSAERTILFKILDEKLLKRNISWSTSSEFIEISTSMNFYEIVKLDDDWFTIIKQDNRGRFGGVRDEFYIADEFEEVVNFLTNFI